MTSPKLDFARRTKTPAYLERVQAEVAVRHAQRATIQAQRNKPLHEKIAEWYSGLPENERGSAYSMSELSDRLKAPGNLLGPALDRLGWRRVRRWRAGEPYLRYWVPHASAFQSSEY